MFKKTLMILAISGMMVAPTANAGLLKKAIIGGGLVTGGVIAYKMAKKMNVGSVTENLANYPDNVEKTLTQNPSFTPTVIKELDVILNDPELPMDEITKYVNLDKIMERHGGGTQIRDPERKKVIDAIKNGETPPSQIVSSTQKGKNTVIKGGTLIESDEVILERNMIAAGQGSKPTGYKAFHIVNPKSPEFAQARAVLANAGVNINSAENGLYLPAGNTKSIDSVHVNELEGNVAYVQYVNKILLENSSTRETVLGALSDIFLKLSNGDKNF